MEKNNTFLEKHTPILEQIEIKTQSSPNSLEELEVVIKSLPIIKTTALNNRNW